MVLTKKGDDGRIYLACNDRTVFFAKYSQVGDYVYVTVPLGKSQVKLSPNLAGRRVRFVMEILPCKKVTVVSKKRKYINKRKNTKR